ncbi:MAG TPA: hypothetical protein VN905_04070 [Candidatus Binatia bacterium]|nr:hypothetical protein [Candidatus Binatia bacterium]
MNLLEYYGMPARISACLALAAMVTALVPAAAQNTSSPGMRGYTPNPRNVNVGPTTHPHSSHSAAPNKNVSKNGQSRYGSNGYGNRYGSNPYQVQPYISIPPEYVNQALATPSPHSTRKPSTNQVNSSGQVFEHYDNRSP